MVRTVLGVLAGVVTWVVLVIGIDIAMSHVWPEYQVAKPMFAFTLPMMIARLVESTVALIVASVVTVRVAPASRAAPWAFGILMLAFFAPFHYTIWTKFPIWYHAYFLASLIAVPVVVSSISKPASPSA